MLKLKRAWGSSEAMDCSSTSTTTLSCPQPKIQFLDPPPTKRTRTATTTPEVIRSPFRPESPFLSIPSPNQDILDNLESYIPPNKRARKIALLSSSSSPSSSSSNSPSPFQSPFSQPPQLQTQTKEKLFTLEDVKGILERALKEQETRLREDYDRVLVDRLQEQFGMFSKFNEDYLSRQMQARPDCNYIS